ncbi:protease inhibitor I9 family protein [Kytococcus sp. Marseille-QA3725]
MHAILRQLLALISLLAALFWGGFTYNPGRPDDPTDPPPAEEQERDDYLVVLEQPQSVEEAGGMSTEAGKKAAREHTEKTVERFRDQGVKVKSTYSTIGGFSAELTPEQVQQLKDDPAVKNVSKDTVVRGYEN